MSDFYDLTHDTEEVEPLDCLCGTPCLALHFAEAARKVYGPAIFTALHSEPSLSEIIQRARRRAHDV